MPERPVRFAILAAPRCGSNWLCTLLDSHPEVLCHHELFNPTGILCSRSWSEEERTALGTEGDRDRDPLGFLERAWGFADGYRAVGFKLNLGQSEAVRRHVLSDPGIRKLVLKRANRVKSYVSERIAEATGEWESYPEAAAGNGHHRVAVEVDGLLHHAERNRLYYEEIEEALAASGQAWLELTYEKLGQEEERRRALRFLGVEPPPEGLREATRKQNPADLRHTIANFEGLAALLQGTALEGDLYASGI